MRCHVLEQEDAVEVRLGEEEAAVHLKKPRESLLRTVVCALPGPRPRVLREQAAHQRPIMCERTRPFHWQTQACVCSGSAEDVSSLCRAKRLQVFIFQLDKDCDLSWREKGQTVYQHELCPAGQSRPSVGRVLGNVLFPVTQKSVWLGPVGSESHDLPTKKARTNQEPLEVADHAANVRASVAGAGLTIMS